MSSLKFNELNLSRRAILTIKVLFLVAACSYIFSVIYNHKDFNKEFFKIWQQLMQSSISYIAIVCILMLANWYLEAYKWRLLIFPLQKINISTAIKSVVSGIALSFMTIGGVGDYLGRALHSNTKDQKALIGITLAGGIYQNLITYTAGGIAFIFFSEVTKSYVFILWLLLLFSFLTISFLLFHAHLLEKFNKLSRFVYALKFHTNKQKTGILLISFIRYAIILTQYYIILLALECPLPFINFFTGIALMLLLKSAIPRISFLSDLGIREFSALLFFSKFGLSPAIIISSTLLLWLLNILLPTLLGLYFITMKKFKANQIY